MTQGSENEQNQGDIATMVLWASVSSDPAFIFDLPEKLRSVRVDAADTDDNDYTVDVRPTTVPRDFKPDEEPRRKTM